MLGDLGDRWTPTDLAGLLGVLGFFLALAALFVQWLQYRWTRAAFREQREERVKVRAIYNPALDPERPHWILQVYVVNVGMVPVFIRSVSLGYDLGRTGLEVMVSQEDKKEGPIAPGDERYYRLKADQYEGMRDIAEVPMESVWLSVCTPEKEIHRLSGHDISFVGVAKDDDSEYADGQL